MLIKESKEGSYHLFQKEEEFLEDAFRKKVEKIYQKEKEQTENSMEEQAEQDVLNRQKILRQLITWMSGMNMAETLLDEFMPNEEAYETKKKGETNRC